MGSAKKTRKSGARETGLDSNHGTRLLRALRSQRTPPARALWASGSGGPLGEDSFFRADLATADACVDSLLAHLERKGLSPLA